MKTSLIIVLMAVAAACQKSDDLDDCIDESLINKEAACTMQYDPVCGCNDKTYGNSCEAVNAGVTEYTEGECAKDETPQS